MPISENNFEKLFKQHFKALCYVAFKVVKDWQIAEDIVQDFFEKFWTTNKNSTDINFFFAYASRSVYNASLNFIKQKANQTVQLESETEIETPTIEEFDDDKFAQINKLLNSIENLPTKRKKFFILFYFEGLKANEIAQQENLSVETVKTHIKLAYRSIRKLFFSFIVLF